MLPAKYIAFITYIWIVGGIFGAIIEGAYLGAGESGILDKVSFWQTISSEQNWGIWEVVGTVKDFFTGIFDMITFRFAFIPGTDWELYRVIIGAPIMGLFVFGLTMTLVGIFSKSAD